MRKNESVSSWIYIIQVYVSEEFYFKKKHSTEYHPLPVSGLWFNGGKGMNTLFI